MHQVEEAIKYGRLLSRSLKNELTPLEKQELEEWLAADEGNRKLLDQISEHLLPGQLKLLQQYNPEAAWEKLSERIQKPAKVVPVYRHWWWAAAVLLVMATGVALYLNKQKASAIAKTGIKKQPAKTEIVPGGEKAILTLGDGRSIVLDNTKNGEVATQGNTRIIKLTDGSILYQVDASETARLDFNTIQTPKGGQFRVTLPDGTNVWLNATSSLRYPTAFSGKERRVEMTGEAYFEVAKNPSMPFKVLINATEQNPAEIQVLGTHFNVNAYYDEANIQATLLEGSVKLSKGNSSGILKPGQQAGISNQGGITLTNNVDIEQVVAWKNGFFIFNSLDVQSIMRQISRWYDVEVYFKGAISKETFSGIVSRRSNISQVLKIMEAGGVKFQMDGKKITVLN